MYNYEKIPQELKEQKRWVLWKKQTQTDGRVTKIPVSSITGYGAKSNDPTTWDTFANALALVEYFNCDGLGFMLGDGYFGVDIDHARDQHELLKEFISQLRSYTEYSQSGEGIHIICRGKLPVGARRKGNIEMYDSARFFAMTGNVCLDTPISERTLEIEPLWEKYINIHAIPQNTPITPKNAENGQYVFSKYLESDNNDLNDSEVIERAINSKGGMLFKDLLDGKWDKYYPSQSEADMAFAIQLAFWTGKNLDQMRRIFENSKLMREKWVRKQGSSTYGEITLLNALNVCQDTYNAPSQQEKGDITPTINNTQYDLNDTGNAQRFVDKYGQDTRYNHDNKCWLLWDGKTWVRDTKQIVKIMVDNLIEDMKNEAYNCTDEKERVEMLRNVKHLSSNGGKEAMLKEAMHIGETATVNADYDNDKYLLNCENGVVDLHTGELLPHDKVFMMSKNTHITIDMENEPKTWLKCINDIFKDSKELVDYVHKAVGYSLTGDVKEQCFFQCYGNGSNGKSVFFNIMYAMLGDYIINAQVESVLSRGGSMGGNASPDIARLKGARFVRTNEPNESARFNEGLVKQLTGGDPITARYLYGSEFEFKPIFKLWIACNYKINVVGTDKGIWRRMRLIPFEACFEGSNDDKNIEDKLRKELPQILGWAVKGCIKWQENGLEPPQEVVDATQTYRTEMDIIEKFSQNCLKPSKNGKEKANELFDEFVQWCKKANEPKMTQTKFGIEMAKKYDKLRLNGYTYYLGIILNKNDTSYVYEKEGK